MVIMVIIINIIIYNNANGNNGLRNGTITKHKGIVYYTSAMEVCIQQSANV